MDELRTLRRTTRADQCVECGKCTSMCPLGTRADFSARLIVGEDLRVELAGRGVGVERCLTCGSCEQRCPQDVAFTEFVKGLRAMVPDRRRRPCPHGAVLRHAAELARSNGSFRSLSWLDEDLRVAEEGEIGLFVGCAPLLDQVFGARLGVEITASTRAAIRLLNRASIEPVLIAEERCCGHDQLWAGDRASFEQLARHNLEAFAARGVKQVISACAECVRTWRLDYPEVATKGIPRVQHLVEWASDKLETLRFHSDEESPERVTYHDPCRLGRHLGVYDAPREVLDALPDVDLREMPRHGRDAVCCGTSGFQHCDSESRRLQSERLRSAEQTGAAVLLTACPKCLVHFSCAQHEDDQRNRERSDVRLVDLTVFTASRLADEESPKESLRGPAMGAST